VNAASTVKAFKNMQTAFAYLIYSRNFILSSG